MSEGFVYEGQFADMELETRERFEATSFNPGEKVVPNPTENASSQLAEIIGSLRTAMARAGVDALTVKASIACNEGAMHEFEEIKGRWNMAAVEDARGARNRFGCVIMKDGDAYFVPLNSSLGDGADFSVDSSESPLPLVSPEMERAARWQVGEFPEDSTGEFILAPCDGGKHVVVAVLWHTGIGEKEREEAITVIETLTPAATESAVPR